MAPSLADSISAITESRPPVTDPLTYLVILESHLSRPLLPHLNTLLQDAQLTKDIGWDLVEKLVAYGEEAENCLMTIARLGNPREVILKITEIIEGLQFGDVDENIDEDEETSDDKKVAEDKKGYKDELGETTDLLAQANLTEENEVGGVEPKNTPLQKFCLLLKLLGVVQPRIKTKNPAAFLRTSIEAIGEAFDKYQPPDEAILAVFLFIRAISGKKRPILPGRQSSAAIQTWLSTIDGGSSAEAAAPDPEAESENTDDAIKQPSILLSFMMILLKNYIGANGLEWAARLQEMYHPEKIVPGRISLRTRYLEDPILRQRDTIVGQLLALMRDLGFTELSSIYKFVSDNNVYVGGRTTILLLIASFVFSSVYFGNSVDLPNIYIFPEHKEIVVDHYIRDEVEKVVNERPGTIDAMLMLGIWAEHNGKLTAKPMIPYHDFQSHLVSLVLVAINSPSPTFRYNAYLLASNVLHACPRDHVRLRFIRQMLKKL